MKIWFTLPFDDNGLQEVDADYVVDDGWQPGVGKKGRWWRGGLEGVDWHRTRESAVAQAVKLRAKRLADLTAEAAHVAALAPIGAEP